MARQVIVLDAQQDSTGVLLQITAVCWLVAPITRVVPSPNFPSRVPPAGTVSWGVTTAEQSALNAGTTVEQLTTISLTTSGFTNAQIITAAESALAARFTSLQNALTTQVFGGIHFVGAQFDGTTWTAGP